MPNPRLRRRSQLTKLNEALPYRSAKALKAESTEPHRAATYSKPLGYTRTFFKCRSSLLEAWTGIPIGIDHRTFSTPVCAV